MDVDYIHRENCRLCDSTNLSKVLSLIPTPPANAFVKKTEIKNTQAVYPLDLYFCQACYHVQLLDVVSPEILFSHYVYVSGTSPVFVHHFENYAEEVCKQANLKDDLVVDIGSNDGTFLGFFKARGCNVLGIDPAIEIARQASESGIETINGFFNSVLADKIINTHGQAKVITANNVFAHIDDIKGVVDGIKKLLHQEGMFVFEVSWLLKLYEGNLFDMIYHEHLDYHSVLSLESFFGQQGMSLFKVQKVNTHGGSIRCYVCFKGASSQEIDASVRECIEEEKAAGLDQASTFMDFSKRIDNIGKKLKELLKELRSQGKSISAFGAPAKATTLMYHFGINNDLIDYVIDDSPLKQGLYTPGLHIPVVDSSCLKKDAPDYLLILAWNFADPIIKKHTDFQDNGGKFIVPLPKVEII
jgi:SAM-dependent methyltransferase